MWKKGVRFRLQKLGLNLLAACCLLPVIFLLANSLCVGGTVSLTQYEDILLYQRPFYVWFWNSAAYTASTLAVSLPVSVLAGYGFSQFSFPGRNFLLGFYVLLMLMPFQATVVSQYLTLNALGLLDTPWAVIWPNAFQTFGVFMMTQFMASIDRNSCRRPGWTVQDMERCFSALCCRCAARLFSPCCCCNSLRAGP